MGARSLRVTHRGWLTCSPAERAGGVVVPQEDPEALAKALGRLLDDCVLAAWPGEAARSRAVECYSLKAVGRVLAATLHEAAPDLPAPPSSL